MIWEREIRIGEAAYPVVISDRQEALLAAKAAGRAVVGLLSKDGDLCLSAARYLVEAIEAADDAYLEKVVRRERGLPWAIGESGRLLVREFALEDVGQVPPEPEDGEADAVFYRREKLEAYIHGQYGFYEYGLWAVVRKEDGKILGKAGVTAAEAGIDGLMLAYHVFTPYRRQGYATEACRIILDYVGREYACPVYAMVEAANTASARLLDKLGFRVMGQKYNGSGHPYILFSGNC